MDSAFSLEPDELRALVEESDRAWRSIGTPELGIHSEEHASLVFRRSLYVVQPMRVGDRLSSENIRSIRPGFGLKPKHYEDLIGRRVNQDVEAGTPISWDLVDLD